MKKITLLFLALAIAVTVFSQDKALRKGFSLEKKGDLSTSNDSAARVGIIIGVNRYSNGLTNLNYAVSDALAMHSALSEIGHFQKENLVLLNDDMGKLDESLKPSKANILRTIKKLVRKKPKYFLFYFSGHGFEIDGKNAVAPTDASFLSDRENNFLRLEEVIDLLWDQENHWKVKQQIFLIDACREIKKGRKGGKGKTSFTRKSFDSLPQSIADGEGLGIFVGTEPGGFSYEEPDLGGGVFTHFILKGLTGEIQNRNGAEYVTYNQLVEYVNQEVKKYYFSSISNKQIPYNMGDRAEDFLISIGRPKTVFRTKTLKWNPIHFEQILYPVPNLQNKSIDAKVLYDMQNKKLQLSFHSFRDNGEIIPDDINNIHRLTYTYGNNSFIAQEFNVKEETNFVHGVRLLPDGSGWELRRVYSDDLSKTGNVRKAKFAKDKKEKVYYQRLVYDLNGNPIVNEYIGSYNETEKEVFKRDTLKPDQEGIARVVQAFDLKSNKTLEEYYDRNRNLKPNKNKIARSVYAFDSIGNPILERYSDVKGRLARNEYGIAQTNYAYKYNTNPYGLLVLKENYDNREYLQEDKHGIARYLYFYDEKCLQKKEASLENARNKVCLKEVRFISREGKRNTLAGMDAKKGLAIQKYQYDEEGRLRSESYFRSNKNPLDFKDGIHSV
ncbi:MAG: caspase family protein, partial [Spirochaetota bacterium]